MPKEDYNRIQKIGEGTYGEVFKAKHLRTGNIVALKQIRIRDPDEGLPKNVFREIQALSHMRAHPHIIDLFEYYPHGSSIVLAFEYMETDLSKILRVSAELDQPLQEAHIKCLVLMLIKGLHSMHTHHLLHRDIKPGNLLLSSGGVLKLGDFGLARVHKEECREEARGRHTMNSASDAVGSGAGSEDGNSADERIETKADNDKSSIASPSTQVNDCRDTRESRAERKRCTRHPYHPYSHEVATRWYRAPELLYGSRHYDHGVDTWAVGCVFGEMLHQRPLFQGETDIDQMNKLQSVLGVMTKENWPEIDQLPDYHKIHFPPHMYADCTGLKTMIEHPSIQGPGQMQKRAQAHTQAQASMEASLELRTAASPSSPSPAPTVPAPTPALSSAPTSACVSASVPAPAPSTVSPSSPPSSPSTSTSSSAPSLCLDLLQRLLIYRPRDRISLSDALEHPYFSAHPHPSQPSALIPVIAQTKLELETRRKAKEQKEAKRRKEAKEKRERKKRERAAQRKQQGGDGRGAAHDRLSDAQSGDEGYSVDIYNDGMLDFSVLFAQDLACDDEDDIDDWIPDLSASLSSVSPPSSSPGSTLSHRTERKGREVGDLSFFIDGRKGQ